MQDHNEVYDKLLEEAKSVRGQQKKGTTLKPPEEYPSPSEDTKYPTIPPKKAKSVVKIAALREGGSVSSASKRADGCAQRGKTRGRMV